MAAGMPPGRAFAKDLRFGRCAKGGEYGLGVGLYVKRVNRAGGAVHVLWAGAPDQKARDL